MRPTDPAQVTAAQPRMRAVLPAWAGAMALMVFFFALHIATGTKTVPVTTVFEALFFPDPAQFDHMIVRDIRLPRALAAILAGAALSVTGALMQGVTRNPLADPHLLGLMSGASLAVVATGFLFGAPPFALIPVLAAVGALAAAVFVLLIAGWIPGGATPLTLTLSGAALTAFIEAIIATLHLFSTTSFDELRIWLSGSLAGQSTQVLVYAAPLIGLGLAISYALAGTVTALAMGDDTARGLGVDARRARGLLLAAVVMMTAASVALVGPLGFVGLLVPHAVRIFTGADYRRIIPWSAMTGALYLTLVDIIARTAIAPQEISTGIITAIIGAPVFVHLVRQRGK